MKRIVSLMFLCLVFLQTLVLTGCSADKAAAPDSTPTIEGRDNRKIYLMAGKIEADEKAEITTKITARVAELSVDIGSVVKKGDPIIKLDAKDLEAQVVQAQAGVNTAQANLAKIQKGARHEQISQAQAALASARITYENAQNSYERNMQLFNEGALSQSQLEQSQTAYAAAEAAYQSAQEALDILNKGETPESIRVMQTQLEQAEAALELTRTQLNNAVVVSPISGIVIAKNINPGEMAAPGISLITVVNLDSLIINAYLPEVHLSKIKDGQEVVVRVAEVPDREFRGEITLIGSVIDPKNKNILVRVKFKDKDYDPSIKPGMFAEIALDY